MVKSLPSVFAHGARKHFKRLPPLIIVQVS